MKSFLDHRPDYDNYKTSKGVQQPQVPVTSGAIHATGSYWLV